MSSKIFLLDDIGEVTVYKRRGTRRINLRVVNNKIKVTQPVWLPYVTGAQFALKNKHWVQEQVTKTPRLSLKDGDQIGKYHTFCIEPGNSLRSKITDNKAIIFIPSHQNTDNPDVITAIKKLIKKVFLIEAQEHLPQRLQQMANNYGFKYRSVKFKSMRSRWGSCNSKKEISLNIYLMALDWMLIDYVLLHELAHTDHLHHGKAFWAAVQAIMPDYKERKLILKSYQAQVFAMQ